MLEMKYFVLKPSGYDAFARASRQAMSVYADHIEEHDPDLAGSLRYWVLRERKNDPKDPSNNNAEQ